MSKVKLKINFVKLNVLTHIIPTSSLFIKKMRFGVFLSVDNYFTFENSKKYVLMTPGPKY